MIEELVSFLLRADLYKYGHWKQYPVGTNKLYSYLCARGSRIEGVDKVVFFGLQYYLIKYLTRKLTEADKELYVKYVTNSLGPQAVDEKILGDIDWIIRNGYLPLKIKAIDEGVKVPLRCPMLTITNTEPGFYWLVNFVETLLSKVWYTCTCATIANLYHELSRASKGSKDPSTLFAFHDFSYRSISSEESAGLSGMSHLLSFKGTDTMLGIVYANTFYNATEWPGFSVPATEHSVMCMGTMEKEEQTISRLLDLYPEGILSIVIDTWDYWNVLTNIVPRLKDKILARNGKTVFRPDSSPKTPYEIICGDPTAKEGTPEALGTLKILDYIFGHTESVSKKINEKVGVIYGDGINYQMAKLIMDDMASKGYHSSNIVFGIGGVNYQFITRDTFNFAIKASYGEINGQGINIFKSPKTDAKKTSLAGRFYVDGNLGVTSGVETAIEDLGRLSTVFENGEIKKRFTFEQVKKNLYPYDGSIY